MTTTLNPTTAAGLPSDTWRALPARHQPHWPREALRDALSELSSRSPLVWPDECDSLKRELAAVARGEAFLIQGGDCAETFEAVALHDIRDKVDTLRQLSVLVAGAARVRAVTVGRMAGQYAKPRSSPMETREGQSHPAYLGDAVNSLDFTAAARTSAPGRLLRAYDASAATLGMLRGPVGTGYASLARLHRLTRDFAQRWFPDGRYDRLLDAIEEAPAPWPAGDGALAGELDIFTSHEGLLLDYEAALTRLDPRSGQPYATSGHLLWIGERTRDPSGAHVEYFSRIRNPIAVKLGPTAAADDVLRLVDRLNPEREPGRLTFVARMGAERVRDLLPTLLGKAAGEGAAAGWVCDPMHGNTVKAPSGQKTRHLADILDEVRGFFEVHAALGLFPGGVHLELTGADVTECVGGASGIGYDDLGSRYESACDPRLNRGQAIELGLRLAGVAAQARRAVDAGTPLPSRFPGA